MTIAIHLRHRLKQRAMRVGAALAAAALTVTLTGCGLGGVNTTATSPVHPLGLSVQGHAFGGQQPIVRASIQLYAANVDGYGTAATPLICCGAYTDSNGYFNITSGYSCPTPGSLVYLTATGGNPGISGTNSNIAEMVALGPCSTVNVNTNIQVNEVTTVASVYALSAFMTGPTHVGAPATNVGGMAMAFADVNELVNTTTGNMPGPSLPQGATLPTAKIFTLANIMANCVNSGGGTAGDMTACGKLFTAATPTGGSAPTDTITAMLNIAQHPGTDVGGIFMLAATQGPYSSQLLHAPNDWTLSINYAPSSLSAPSSIAVDAYGNAWIANRTGNTVTELTHSGAVGAGTTYSAALNAPSALALDASGNPWVAESGNSALIYLTPSSGSPVAGGTGGLSAPTAAAIDAQGNVWVANSGANTVSEFTSAGAPVTASGYSGAGIVKPLGIAISPH